MKAPPLFFLAARAALVVSPLALFFCVTEAYAQPGPPPRLTVRLDYRPGAGTEHCPTEHSIRIMLNRFFGYDAIEPTARPTLTLAVSRTPDGKVYETMSVVSDEDGRVLWNQVARTNITNCFEHMMNATLLLHLIAYDRLRPPRGPREALPADPLPVAPLSPAPEAEKTPDAPAPSTPLAAAPKRSAEGFLLNTGLLFSYGLTPTVSLGGVASLMYRKGEYSGALEARVDHGLVPAHFRAFPVESLFAGATLALPCAHRGAFNGCLVSEAGGFAFSAATGVPLSGSRWLLAFGLRASLEWPVAEHFVLRAFAQASAVPVGARLIIDDSLVWRSLPGFASIGFTILVNR